MDDRSGAQQVQSAEDRTWLAGWHARLPVVGIALAAVTIPDGDWLAAAVGIGLTAFGAWLAIRQLHDRDVLQRLLWIGVYVAALLLAVGILLVADGRWVLWVPAIAAAFLADDFASMAAPPRRAR